nr:hypothetical protein [Tanacetum cinerariifolium]
MQELIRKLFNDVPNIHEELAEYINTPSWNRHAFSNYDNDDDEDYTIAITPKEPDNSLIKFKKGRLEKADQKSSVEDLVPIPSESEGENSCDVPSCFTTFSNILFDADYDFESVDDQSLHNEDVSEKIFSNPLFEEEIISIRIYQHHLNAESDLAESMLNRDSSNNDYDAEFAIVKRVVKLGLLHS